ncbi:MAG TPA: VWA domain-containing protein [Chitinophagales bacterium]|nr:VWA domain-containing protein [Chitinophagales bacterium]HMU97438.1 VWA domain-containing protein [Chitinophagales bacterium]HMW93384.1 VWA domain-containing protein [Chitinophagales bacterium]HMZ67920.1 VWA domain-containing protein [Chitinophagales bacterium]HNB37723.1 VWA domain-containing protein [Chitinophagales bacterium]
MEIDEIIYSKVLRFFKNRKENNAEVLNRKVLLSDLKPRLTLIARAICGTAIEIFPAEREGGFKNDNFFLPISVALFQSKEENIQFYIFRTIYLCVQKQLEFNWTETIYSEELSSVKAIETAPDVLKKMFEDYPSLQDNFEVLFNQLPIDKKTQKPDVYWLYGKWMKNTQEENNADKLQNFDNQANQLINKIEAKTTLHTKAVEEIESLTIDKKQQEDYVLMHSFEKIETAEEFNGNWRDFDGEDDLKDHQEALEEMNMKFTVRVDDTVHSVYQADFVENTSVSESSEIDEKGFHLKYDEWDFKNRKYLVDYCKVYPKSQVKTDTIYYKNTLTKYRTILVSLRKMLTSVNNKMQQQRRQIQGELFDLDALTDLYTAIHSKVSPDERIYLSQRKKDKDIAILLLLDISLSSDGYAAGKRIIDVEKDVSILFGEILNEFNIEFSIDGFSSKTRNFSTYITLKDFNEDWNKAKYKIGAVEPNGYTRIGPALRHAGARLSKTEAKNKWIILLSDGKPNDYDRYEGQHGINDVKQALRELNEAKINSYALAIEAQAKYYLPQMFGQNHYQILTSPEELIKSLAKLYEKIKHN